MKTQSIQELTLYFEAEEQPAATLIADACERTLPLLHQRWRLGPAQDCHIYVMTSWRTFVFRSAPWPWRIYMALTLPLRYSRIQQLWSMSGGWAQRYGSRTTIGLKPPHLLQQLDSNLRDRIFFPREVEEWLQHNTCHELVHACTDHLGLPTWLHEGLAMVAVDHLAQRPTVKPETLAALAAPPQVDRQAITPETLIYHAVRGYWITRYLDDTQPTLLTGLLSQPQDALEDTLATGLGMSWEEFDVQINATVMAHFGAQKTQREGEHHGR